MTLSVTGSYVRRKSWGDATIDYLSNSEIDRLVGDIK